MIKNHCPLLHMQRDISWLLLSIFPLSQPCPAALRGVTYRIGAEAKGKYISPSSPVSRSMAGCFCAAKYRGEPRSMAMRRGLKKTLSRDNRGNPPLPLCS